MTKQTQPRFTSKQQNQLGELFAMLSTMRPGGSTTEELFIREYLLPLPNATQDGYGNVIVRIGDAPILWSSHTDTVHRRHGAQRVEYDATTDCLTLAPKQDASCLGADCTTGVWLMRQMILASVPGLYVFHRDEEQGGYGSAFIVDTTPELLTGITHAIAFDRKGASDIITHQCVGRCASDSFAEHFATLLPSGYRADDSGSFTDTANYAHIIPECTNISVGYAKQHTSAETQSIGVAMRLLSCLEKLTQAELSNLPTARNPEHKTSPYFTGDFDYRTDMEELVWRNTEAIALLLEQLGWSPQDVADYCGDTL